MEKPEELALRVKVKRMYEVADRISEEAVSPEKLQNNPFKGKPLDLSVNPFEKERALGHRMLKNSGFAPAWIEMKRELIAERKDIRRMIDDYVAKVESRPSPRPAFSKLEPGADAGTDDPLHAKFFQRVHDRVTGLRKKIERYNLETPIPDQQLMNERPEEWVAESRRRVEVARGRR